jgi:hypothetical protein
MIESVSQLGLAFFGLTYNNIPLARASLFNQIHQIVFHGKGGYDWHTVYNMPIWLRRWTFNEIRNHYEEEKEAVENPGNNKGGKQTVINSDGTIKAPDLLKNSQSSKKPVKYG